MDDELVLRSAEQVRAFAHPLRQQIFRLLAQEPMTNKQIAAALNESPARVHFHVRELASARLIELVEERRVGGVIAKYYRAVARHVRLGPEMGASLATRDLLDAILDVAAREFGAVITQFDRPIPGTRVVQETVPLTADALARVRALLDQIDAEIQAAQALPQDETTQSVLLTYVLIPLPDHPPASDIGEATS